jgi:hypothetical protein
MRSGSKMGSTTLMPHPSRLYAKGRILSACRASEIGRDKHARKRRLGSLNTTLNGAVRAKLAGELGAALGQERIYVAFADRTRKRIDRACRTSIDATLPTTLKKVPADIRRAMGDGPVHPSLARSRHCTIAKRRLVGRAIS